MDYGWLIEDDRQCKEALAEVETLVSPEMFQSIKDYLDDDGYTHMYSIVDEPVGDYQTEEEYPSIDGVWVDQYTCGGMEDNFYGTVCIKLPDGRYFMHHYNT
jgi:hypothetical protein